MQTEAASEGRLHSCPAGYLSVVVEGEIPPHRAHLAGPTYPLNNSVRGDVDRGVKRYMLQSVQHSQLGRISQLLAGGVAGAVSKTFIAPFSRLTILFQVAMLVDGIFKTVEFDAMRIIFNRFQSIVSFVPTMSTILSAEVVEKESEAGGKLGDLDSYEIEGDETKYEVLQNLSEFTLFVLLVTCFVGPK